MSRPTARSVLATVAPGSRYEEVFWSPPDVVAFVHEILSASGAYRLAISPPGAWPPDGWSSEVRSIAHEWRSKVNQQLDGKRVILPSRLRELRDNLCHSLDQPLAWFAEPSNWAATSSLLKLSAASDEASRADFGPAMDEYSRSALAGLLLRGSLGKPGRARVLPRYRSCQAGINSNSLYLNAIFAEGEAQVRWSRVDRGDRSDRFNLLVLPWPLKVEDRWFTPASNLLHCSMNREHFGFFDFSPDVDIDHDRLVELLRQARRLVGQVDMIVLPECALTDGQLFELLSRLTTELKSECPCVLGGVRRASDMDVWGKNAAVFSYWNNANEAWVQIEQGKHHRWALDRSQIRNYRLAEQLDPGRRWWEAIAVEQRSVSIIELRDWLAICPLICEDLARQDPVARLVRAVGPTLVVALLLDGPQLRQRWSARYATVLADDPGASVLTVTSLGMAVRSAPAGTTSSPTVALWKDSASDATELNLQANQQALLLELKGETVTDWSADGRSRDVRRLALANCSPLS